MSWKSGPASDPGGTPAGILARARADRKAELDYQTRVLKDALEWGHLHAVPAEEVDELRIATWRGTPIPLAGEGAPLVEEFCVPELATALGLSQDAGRSLLAQSLELGHRLPRLWERVQDRHAPAWKARKVADLTLGLTPQAADWVDAHVADYVQTMSMAAVERLVEEAITRYMPTAAEERRRRAADGRRFDIHHDQVSFNGTSRIEGELDLADALDLDAALTAGAKQLSDLGCQESLDVRRSKAAGDLARRQLAFGFPGTDDTTGSGRDSESGAGQSANPSGEQAGERDTAAPSGQPPTPIKPGRQVVLYVHLHESAIRSTNSAPTSTGAGADVARVENRGPHLVTADTIREWLGADATTGGAGGTKVTVRPVIDLNDHTAVDSYEIPDRIREAVILRDKRRNLGSHATPWLLVVLTRISPSISAGVRNPCRLRGLELSSAAMLSSIPGP